MTRRVAIVGAGPAGCYLAQALRRLPEPPEVDVLERLAVPYGLLRHGVAADHQSTKAVARQFARLFAGSGVRFLGGCELGTDIDLDELRTRYNAVVLTTGAARDRQLAIPGDELLGVHAGAAVARALNDHPDAPGLPALGRRPLIVGAGNVALDLARLMLRDADGLEGTDLSPAATRWLLDHSPRRITIVARGSAETARFDPAMLAELGSLPGVRVAVPDVRGAGGVAEALRRLDGTGDGPATLTILFGRRPVRVVGKDHVEGLAVDRAGTSELIAATSVLASIGAEAAPPPTGPGLYAVGWCDGSARGALPEARAAARTLASRIGEALPRLRAPIAARLPATVWDWSAWEAIDLAERAAADPGRVRRKITDAAAWAATREGAHG